MPFQSKAQQHWMFANHPEMAKEWATNTNFAALPDKKDTAACEESNQAIIRLRDKLKQQREARESNQAILRLRDKLRQQREIKEANQAAVNFRDIIKHGMFKLRLKQAMFKLRLKQVMIKVRDERKRRKAAKEAAFQALAKAAPNLLRSSQKSLASYFSKQPVKSLSQTTPPIGNSLGQPAKPPAINPTEFWAAFKKGYQDHVQQVKNVQNAKPVTGGQHQSFNQPNHISRANTKAFQNGDWTSDSYRVVGPFETAGNQPLPDETMQGLYNAAHTLFPTQGRRAGEYIRQARPAAITADETLRNHGEFNPITSELKIKLNQPTVAAHELGHSVQAPASQKQMKRLGGRFDPNNPAEGSPLATLNYENEANDIGYQILKQAKKTNVEGITKADVQDMLNKAKHGADRRYLPEAMTELDDLWKNDKNGFAELFGGKVRQLFTNTNAAGFERALSRLSQWANTLAAPRNATKHLIERDLAAQLRSKGSLNASDENFSSLFWSDPKGTLLALPEVVRRIRAKYPTITKLNDLETAGLGAATSAAAYGSYQLGKQLGNYILPNQQQQDTQTWDGEK
jgi:hypothetical protein